MKRGMDWMPWRMGVGLVVALASASSCTSVPAESVGGGGAGGGGGASTSATSSGGGGPTSVVSATSASTSACVPKSGPDSPDDDFADTNCDGIDGNVSQAIFVAPSGSDDSPGTIAAPVAHLQTGIVLATAQHKDVYVCLGTYAENVVVDGLTAAMGIYGGYDCTAGWKRTTSRPVVAPSSGVPLRVRSSTGAITVDRMAFHAPGGVKAGESSVAAFVSDSTQVSFHQGSLEAGDGADGAGGQPVTSLAPLGPGPDGVSFATTACNQIVLPVPTLCALMAGGGIYQGVSPAPNGGRGGNVYTKHDPERGTTMPGGASGGAIGFDGAPGARGAHPGTVGGAATADLGTVGPEGYRPTNGGADGTAGDPGQAGGGGAGGSSIFICSTDPCDQTIFYVGGGGGAGGLGGAGGAGGKAGGGGGASIALLSLNSSVTTTWVTFKTGVGGRGGSGSAGANGQKGGAGGKKGTGTDSLGRGDGHAGGAGGSGAPGGAGGPGGGGPSIAVLAVGPTSGNSTAQFQVGTGGKGGVGTSGPDGVDGRTADVVVLSADAGVP